MFDHLVLDHSDFTYTRLQGLIWTASGIGLPTLLEEKAGTLLKDILCNYRTDVPIVINCKSVLEIDDHALAKVFPVLKSISRQTIFINVGSIWERINPQINEIKRLKVNYDFETESLIVGNGSINSVENINGTIEETEKKYIDQAVSKCFKKFKEKERLYSTPILASGVFDARYLISGPKSFLWISLIMAEKLGEYLQTTKPTPPLMQNKLLAVSLRGSPFAASIGFLINKDFDVIDHFGPRHKIFDFDVLENMQQGIRYIYVGDFIVGGTELKIAKTYAQSRGSVLEHAIVIGSLLEPKSYGSEVEVLSLTNLREVCEGLDYSVF